MKCLLNPLSLGGDVKFEEFQNDRHGGHLGFQDGTILAILNLHAPIPLMKFRLNPMFCSGDVI